MEPARLGVTSGPVDKVVRQLAGECGDAVPYGRLLGTVARCADDLQRLSGGAAPFEVDPDDFAAVLEDLARGRLVALTTPAPRGPQR